MSARQLIKNAIIKCPQRIRRDLVLAGLAAGEDLPGYYVYPSLKQTLKQLRTRGFAPKYAVDVGAFKGEWTELWKELFPDSAVLMVEPQRSKAGLLSRLCSRYGPSVQFESVVAGAADGTTVRFYEMEEGSSIFGELSNRPRETTTRETVTIDTLTPKAFGSAPVDMLKLDTQGSEVEVLKGAATTVANASFVLLEASLIPINHGCPLVHEVLSFMLDRHFRLYDICGQWRRPDHVLWQVDLLFVRDTSEFAPKPELNGNAFGNWAIDPA